MVVTCPQCSKRYMLDDTLLPQEGRQVRCIACHHVWRKIPDATLHPPTSSFLEADIALQMNVSSERTTSWLGWIVFFSILMICLSTLIIGRNMIVAHWPAAERYYELI